MKESSRIISHTEKLSNELKAIRKNVSRDDRKAIENEHHFTKGTISRYLNGNINSIDTAVAMLTFFRKRIAEREKLISQN